MKHLYPFKIEIKITAIEPHDQFDLLELNAAI